TLRNRGQGHRGAFGGDRVGGRHGDTSTDSETSRDLRVWPNIGHVFGWGGRKCESVTLRRARASAVARTQAARRGGPGPGRAGHARDRTPKERWRGRGRTRRRSETAGTGAASSRKERDESRPESTRDRTRRSRCPGSLVRPTHTDL